jgi:hypothetical protein
VKLARVEVADPETGVCFAFTLNLRLRPRSISPWDRSLTWTAPLLSLIVTFPLPVAGRPLTLSFRLLT